VSLNTHDNETYIQVCKLLFDKAFEKVLKLIEKADGEFDTEVTTVIISEVDIQKVKEIAEKMGVKFRIKQYIPCFW
jgi:molybdenum cofactor biosynthesis enzyme MoaA